MDKMLRWFRKKRIAFSAHVQLITTVMIEESLGENPKQGSVPLQYILVCSSLYSCNGIQREYYNAKDMSESSICTLYSLPVWWGFFLHFDN